MNDLTNNLIDDENLDNVTGGATTYGLDSQYDTPESVAFTFSTINMFVRVAAKYKRAVVLSYSAELDPSTGKYGAYYEVRDNRGTVEHYWERELTTG